MAAPERDLVSPWKTPRFDVAGATGVAVSRVSPWKAPRFDVAGEERGNSMAESAMNEHFVELLMQLHYTAWVQLGKVASPATGKVERNLEAAKATIDVLGAVEEKSKGNLHADEAKLLTGMLLDLRMNYVEEVKQGTARPMDGAAAEGSKPAAAAPPAQAQSSAGSTAAADRSPPSAAEGLDKS